MSTGLSPGSSAFPSANLALFMPLFLPSPYVMRRIGWQNGTTVAATNHIDIGIYTDGGTKIYSTGSTVQGSASALQSVALATPMTLPAGVYYWGFQCDTAVATFQRYAVSVIGGRLMGYLQQAVGSFGLPSVMTPVAYAQAYAPHCWMSWHPSY